MNKQLFRFGPFTQTRRLDAIAFRFFKQFSRMEYALKAAGKLKRPDGPAEVDWLGFGDEIDAAFQAKVADDKDLKEARDFVLGDPPKKQMVQDRSLYWKETIPDSKTETSLLLQYVCRMRNNLFHGGKFGLDWVDPDRSEALLFHGLMILNACIDIDLTVEENYQY